MSCFQAKKRFNDCLCKNAQLRDEIESLRNEHKRFETLYKKLEKELRSLRREMGEVIEKSTAAYDARWVQFSGHDHPSHASFHPHPAPFISSPTPPQPPERVFSCRLYSEDMHMYAEGCGRVNNMHKWEGGGDFYFHD